MKAKDLTEEEMQEIANEQRAKAKKDIELARKRGIRNAIITAAGIGVFAAVIVATGLTWGFTLPTITFAASWGILGAGVTWGVGFWANSKNRWLKKLQKGKQIKETGQVQTRKGPQNVPTQAVAKSNQKHQSRLDKFAKKRMARNNPAYLEYFNTNTALNNEEKDAQEEIKNIVSREEALNDLSGKVLNETLPTADELESLKDVKAVDGYMQIESEDLLKNGLVTTLPKLKYGDEYSKEASFLRTLGVLKDGTADICFPITITQFSKGKENYEAGSSVVVGSAKDAEALYDAQADRVRGYKETHTNAKVA